jgi:pyruvate dehydrogenase E2 component (dihydrolipoamide acetyltransferase)
VESKEDVGKTKTATPPPAAAAAPATPKAAPAAPVSPSKPQEAPKAAPKKSTLPEHILMTMPSLSPTMTQGKLGEWKVKVGDQIKPGTILAQIETDKVNGLS